MNPEMRRKKCYYGHHVLASEAPGSLEFSYYVPIRNSNTSNLLTQNKKGDHKGDKDRY